MKPAIRTVFAFALFAACALAATRLAVAQDMSGSMPMKSASKKDMSKTKTKTKSYSIAIKDFAFGPATLTVPVGATVTWTNEDEEPHTVFSTDNAFKSQALDTDEKFSFTFKKAGTYKYFCSVHPKMVGTVVVGKATKSEPMKMDKMGGMDMGSSGKPNGPGQVK